MLRLVLRERSCRPAFVLSLLVVAGCALVVDTYAVFDHTWDEPAHLAAGLELLDRGEYSHALLHPPLARLALALGPYLRGARFDTGGAPHDGRTLYKEGLRQLYDEGPYDVVLTLARLGNLPFLALIMVTSWWLARRHADGWAALATVVLVGACSPLLGHAAIATLDVAAAATLLLAVLALVRWRDHPIRWRALWAGVAVGLALMTKYSAVPFLLSSGIAVGLFSFARPERVAGPSSIARRVLLPQLVVAGAGVVGVCWACFGFRLVPLDDGHGRLEHAVDQHLGGASLAGRAVRSVAQVPAVPAFVLPVAGGVVELAGYNRRGHPSFLLGEIRQHGWWYYYVVNLMVRAPLPLLLLGLPGLVLLLVQGWRKRSWTRAAPALVFVAVLTFASAFSNIQCGVRHVLALLALLAVASAATAQLLVHRHRLGAVVVVALLLVQAGSCARDHPDHLTSFNALAGSSPERILLGTDLDWGQDLKRLAVELRRRGIERVAIAYHGSADPARHGIAGFEPLPAGQPRSGWIAISLWKKVRHRPGYDWLDSHRPVARIGRSIDLYHIEVSADPAVCGAHP